MLTISTNTNTNTNIWWQLYKIAWWNYKYNFLGRWRLRTETTPSLLRTSKLPCVWCEGQNLNDDSVKERVWWIWWWWYLCCCPPTKYSWAFYLPVCHHLHVQHHQQSLHTIWHTFAFTFISKVGLNFDGGLMMLMI